VWFDFRRESRLSYSELVGDESESLVEQSSTQSVSSLLFKWREGDEDALRDLLPLVYNELRRLAHYYIQRQRPDHTLQSTALVHEAYLRLAKQGKGKFQNRAHFFAICAQLMRQILVEYARSQEAAKRNRAQKVTFNDAVGLTKSRSLDLVALDDALNGLAKIDPQQSRVVELRFFGGLSIEDTARVLGISPATVKRDWSTAKAWLHHELSRMAEHDA
jgi:RNA polymerase sigma factor (TIGR02999 family)